MMEKCRKVVVQEYHATWSIIGASDEGKSDKRRVKIPIGPSRRAPSSVRNLEDTFDHLVSQTHDLLS